MNNLSKTIAEVKSALDQATKMLDENQTLRDEIQTLKASPNTHRRQRELKIAQLSFKQGIESVLFQLRENDHETEHSIEESSYDNGFDLTFSKDVEISIPISEIIDEHYVEESQEVIDTMLLDEVIAQVDAGL